MKKFLFAILMIALSAGLCVSVVYTDWFRRNYAYFGDQIHIYVYEDGELLEPGDYEIGPQEWWYHEELGNPFTENRRGYSLKGDYGTFWFRLKYQGREAEFFLENVNDWWRTNINLYMDTNTDQVHQTNIVWNNDPALADSFTLQWQETTK